MNFNTIYREASLLRRKSIREGVERTSDETFKPFWSDPYYCDILLDILKDEETREHEQVEVTEDYNIREYNKYLQKMLNKYIDRAFEAVANGSEWYGDIKDVKAKADLDNGRVMFKYETSEGIDPDSCLRFTRELVNYLSRRDFNLISREEQDVNEDLFEEGTVFGFVFHKDGAYTYQAKYPRGYDSERSYL